MFKTRLFSAIVGLIILFGVMIFGKEIFPLVVCVIALIGLNELYTSFENKGFKPIKIIGYLSALLILMAGVIEEDMICNSPFMLKHGMLQILSLFYGLSLIVSFAMTVIWNTKYKILDVAITMLGMGYVSLFFTYLVLIRNLDEGIHFLWLVFIGAWATDTFAYFTGMKFGKRKLIPAVSPKKTIEGSIGGILGCMAMTVAYGYFANKSDLFDVGLYHFVIIGFLSGIVSQIGDLTASSIKRYVDVKDFGKIMPGHGGVLDRFDSILIVAPIVYYYVVFVIQ